MVFLKILGFKNYQIPTMHEKAIIFRRVRMVSAIIRVVVTFFRKRALYEYKF